MKKKINNGAIPQATNRQLLEKINEADMQEESISAQEDLVKFVVFEIDNIQFALPGDVVQEIILDREIYYLPFTPPYIRGLINRHGEPYTVIDVKILFKKEKLEASKFIIIRDKVDKLSLLITEITKIINVHKNEIKNITSKNENRDYFTSSVTIEESEILVIDISRIMKKISNDIE